MSKPIIKNNNFLNQRNRTLRKKRGRTKIIFISSLILMVALAIVVTLVFDVGGVYTRIFIGDNKGEVYQNISKELEVEKDRLESLSLTLKAKEEELREMETGLLERQNEVETLLEQLSSKFEDVLSMTRLYERMEPYKAASIMLKYPEKEVNASILKYMNKSKAAEILSAMDDESAAELLQILLPEGEY